MPLYQPVGFVQQIASNQFNATLCHYGNSSYNSSMTCTVSTFAATNTHEFYTDGSSVYIRLLAPISCVRNVFSYSTRQETPVSFYQCNLPTGLTANIGYGVSNNVLFVPKDVATSDLRASPGTYSYGYNNQLSLAVEPILVMDNDEAAGMAARNLVRLDRTTVLLNCRSTFLASNNQFHEQFYDTISLCPNTLVYYMEASGSRGKTKWWRATVPGYDVNAATDEETLANRTVVTSWGTLDKKGQSLNITGRSRRWSARTLRLRLNTRLRNGYQFCLPKGSVTPVADLVRPEDIDTTAALVKTLPKFGRAVLRD